MEVKIKNYKIGPRGRRGHLISVPKVWVDDNNLRNGDVIEFYRDERDRLILVAVKNNIPRLVKK